MEKYDMVRLAHMQPKYKQYRIFEDGKGIILSMKNPDAPKVLFLNLTNDGDYAYLSVDIHDLEYVEDENKEESIKLYKKVFDKFKPKDKGFEFDRTINYPVATVNVERPEYLRFKVHKGDKGLILFNKIKGNSILVDFGHVDQNGTYIGESVYIRLTDITIERK